MRGPIPLFAGIERFDYSRLHGGPLHHRLLEWGPMLAFQLGIFFSIPMLHNRPSDWRFGVLFGTLILYLFLAGHRFSSLYAYTSFFIMPLGAVLIGREAKSPSLGEMLSRTILRWLAAAAVPAPAARTDRRPGSRDQGSGINGMCVRELHGGTARRLADLRPSFRHWL